MDGCLGKAYAELVLVFLGVVMRAFQYRIVFRSIPRETQAAIWEYSALIGPFNPLRTFYP